MKKLIRNLLIGVFLFIVLIGVISGIEERVTKSTMEENAPELIVSQCSKLKEFANKHPFIYFELTGRDPHTAEFILNRRCLGVDFNATSRLTRTILGNESVPEDSKKSAIPFSLGEDNSGPIDWSTSSQDGDINESNWRTTLTKDIAYVASCLDVTGSALHNKKCILSEDCKYVRMIPGDDICFNTRPTRVAWKNFCNEEKREFLQKKDTSIFTPPDDDEKSIAEQCGEDGETWHRDRMGKKIDKFAKPFKDLEEAFVGEEAIKDAKSSPYCKPPYTLTFGLEPMWCAIALNH
jgi:hypothetical protein